MNLVEKIFLDPITKTIRMVSKAGSVSVPNFPVYEVGGQGPMVLSSVSNFGTITLLRGIFKIFKDQEGKWFLDMRVLFSTSGSSSSNVFTLAISNVTFKSISSYSQPIPFTQGVSGSGQTIALDCFTVPGTNEIRLYTVGTFNPGTAPMCFSGVVELDNKPHFIKGQ